MAKNEKQEEAPNGYDNRDLRGNDLGNNYFRGFNDVNTEGDLYEEVAERGDVDAVTNAVTQDGSPCEEAEEESEEDEDAS